MSRKGSRREMNQNGSFKSPKRSLPELRPSESTLIGAFTGWGHYCLHLLRVVLNLTGPPLGDPSESMERGGLRFMYLLTGRIKHPLLCYAEAIEMILFCSSPINDVQEEAQCQGSGRSWPPLHLSGSNLSPEYFFFMILIIWHWFGIYKNVWFRKASKHWCWNWKTKWLFKCSKQM